MLLAVSNVYKNIKDFFKMDYSGVIFVITTVIYALTLLSLAPNDVIIYLSLILNFSSFDRIGWHHLKPTSETQIVGYRIIQHGYLILLGASLFHVGADIAIAFIMSWYMGVCDFLYYLIGKEYGYIKYTNMYWLWWCPWAYFGIKKTGKTLTFWSIITLIVSIGIILL